MRISRDLVSVLAVLSISALVMAASATADGRRVSGSQSRAIGIDTSICPGLATAQPGLSMAGTIAFNADVKYSYFDDIAVWRNVVAQIRGTAVDVNTGATFSFVGQFHNPVFTVDVLGYGHFSFRRNDGMMLSGDGAYNWAGPGGPNIEFAPSAVRCTGADTK